MKRDTGDQVLAVSPVDRLVDAHHRQPPPVGVDSVAHAGELLLLHQQLLAGGEPLLSGHYLPKIYRVLLLVSCGQLANASTLASIGGRGITQTSDH